jgi:hypothetical protein
VHDPAAKIPGDTRALTENERAMIQLANGKPLAMLLETTVAVRLLSKLDASMDYIVHKLTADRPTGLVPVVVSFGSNVGVVFIDPDEQCDADVSLRTGEARPHGDGYMLTLTGALKVYLRTEPEMLKPEGRDRHARFVAIARAALQAEAIRQNPREVGDVLIDAFGGARLRSAFSMRGPHGLVETIDAVLKEHSANVN